MNGLLPALRRVESELTREKGEFALFACLLPAESQDQWDLVVSAAWASRHRPETLRLLVSALDRNMPAVERLAIARIVVVEPSDRDVQRINEAVTIENGAYEIVSEEHFGYLVARGFVIASHDYWRFLKRLFPSEAIVNVDSKDLDLQMSVWWTLHDDATRPDKQSRIIRIRISFEVLFNYIYVDRSSRADAEQVLVEYVTEKLRHFNPQHAAPFGRVPPIESWDIGMAVFQKKVARHGAA